ncbi:MAG: PEP-CTERM sorting domain-containing protein, partial [Planctomycetota bacterium]
TIDGHEGVWPLSGEIDVYLPNYQELQPKKEIWIQLTWKPTDVDFFLPNEPLIGVAPFESMEMSRQDSVGQDGWVSSLFMIDIWPNPSEEWISIKGDIMVDDLTIDTYCIPEPVTILLLGVGGALITITGKRRFLNGSSRERDESKQSRRSRR